MGAIRGVIVLTAAMLVLVASSATEDVAHASPTNCTTKLLYVQIGGALDCAITEIQAGVDEEVGYVDEEIQDQANDTPDGDVAPSLEITCNATATDPYLTRLGGIRGTGTFGCDPPQIGYTVKICLDKHVAPNLPVMSYCGPYKSNKKRRSSIWNAHTHRVCEPGIWYTHTEGNLGTIKDDEHSDNELVVTPADCGMQIRTEP